MSYCGIMNTIVSDNGPCFISEEFDAFCKANGIRRVPVIPYHPASNGQAERSVQTVKSGLMKTKGGSLENRLLKFLSRYPVTPHTTTGRSSAELMFGMKSRTTLDLMKPDAK